MMNVSIRKIETGYMVTVWNDSGLSAREQQWAYPTLNEVFVKAKELLETTATSYPTVGGGATVGLMGTSNTASATWSTPTASTNTEATDKTDAE